MTPGINPEDHQFNEDNDAEEEEVEIAQKLESDNFVKADSVKIMSVD